MAQEKMNATFAHNLNIAKQVWEHLMGPIEVEAEAVENA
jgi:hypothetical protein